MKTCRFARAAFWPTNSASASGRIEASGSSLALVGGEEAAGIGHRRPLTAPAPSAPAESGLRLGSLLGLLERGGDRRRGLGLGVAEIDQGRDRVRDRAGRAPWSSTAPDRRIRAGSRAAKAGALSLSSATMRWASFGPTPGPRATDGLVAGGDGGGEARRDRGRTEWPSATLAPTPWTVWSRRNHSRSASERKP